MPDATKQLINTGPSERGWHFVEDFLHCPQLYAYRNILKLPANAYALVRGSIGHVGLAHFFTRKKLEQDGQRQRVNDYYEPIEAMEKVAPEWGALGAEALPEARVGAQYFVKEHTYFKDQVLAVEEPVRARIGWPDRIAALRPGTRMVFNAAGDPEPRRYLITQRLDLVLRDASGGVWFWDHKFVARSKSEVFSRYVLSGQFLLAQWFGAALYGDAFRGVKVNLVVVGEKKPRFVRESVAPAPFALRTLPQAICDANEQIENLAAEGRDPWDYPKAFHETACVTPYGKCAFFEVCRWGQ